MVHYMIRQGTRWVLVVLIGVVASGCNADRKPRLSGVVKIDGLPLADAEVQMVITPNNRPTAVAGGWTDAEGKYEIRKITPRNYRVAIRKYLRPDGTPLSRAET